MRRRFLCGVVLCGLPSLLCLDFWVCCFELGGRCLLACAITNNTNNTLRIVPISIYESTSFAVVAAAAVVGK